MFAVVRTGGKQYRVSENARIEVERLPGEPGETLALADVLMLGGAGAALKLGAPLVENAAVFAEIVDQKRGPKVLVFKKKRRKHYRRMHGHRQDVTVLRITGISPTGEPPARAADDAGDNEASAAPVVEAGGASDTEE